MILGPRTRQWPVSMPGHSDWWLGSRVPGIIQASIPHTNLSCLNYKDNSVVSFHYKKSTQTSSRVINTQCRACCQSKNICIIITALWHLYNNKQSLCCICIYQRPGECVMCCHGTGGYHHSHHATLDTGPIRGPGIRPRHLSHINGDRVNCCNQ